MNVRSFASGERLEKLNSENTAVDLRWGEMRWFELLKRFTNRHIPRANVTKLVESVVSGYKCANRAGILAN